MIDLGKIFDTFPEDCLAFSQRENQVYMLTFILIIFVVVFLAVVVVVVGGGGGGSFPNSRR